MSFETWLTFCVVETLLCLTPGPAVMFVVSQAAWRGPRAGIAAACGISVGNLIYYLLSALGLAALIAASHAVFLTLKWVGAGYLVLLGLLAIRESFKRGRFEPAPARPVHHGLRDGIVVQLANPKAMLFFVALMPLFLDPAGDVPMQIVILGATTTVTEIAVLTGYSLLAGAGRRLAASEAMTRWLKRGIGGVFVALAAAAALYRRAV